MMITRKIKRFLFGLLAVGMLTAFALGLLTMRAIKESEVKPWAGVVFDARLMSGERPLDVLSLREMVGDAVDDDEAKGAISTYYEANAGRLAEIFEESNETRLRGLFGMYITHTAVPYNVVEREPQTLLEFIGAPAAHCGVYARAQSQVYDALGLRWHEVTVDDGWHGLIEAEIDGQWETFDATSNVWLSVSVGGLIGGLPRVWREFYTPITDARAGEIYREHLLTGHNVPELRAGLPLWGISVHPRTWVISASG